MSESIVGVLLAAGAGRRYGEPKVLAHDGRWLSTAVDALRGGGCDHVFVVLGAADTRMPDGATAVYAPDWDRGMSSSLKTGLAVAGDADYAVVHVVDTPDVGSDVVRAVLSAARDSVSGIARAVFDAVPGHPVVFPQKYFSAVIDSAVGDAGARGFLRGRSDVAIVECSHLATGVDHDYPNEIAETRAAYDTVAESYTALLRNELADKPLDRGLLTVLAEMASTGPVLDAGCGSGRVSQFLTSIGSDVVGVDLSAEMVARATGGVFCVASMHELPFAAASFAGILAWYSIIHTRPDELGGLFDEFSRVLRPGGVLLVAFQVGSNERVHLTDVYGHEVSYHVYRLAPTHVVECLRDSGFILETRVVREPSGPEQHQQAYLIAWSA